MNAKRVSHELLPREMGERETTHSGGRPDHSLRFRNANLSRKLSLAALNLTGFPHSLRVALVKTYTPRCLRITVWIVDERIQHHDRCIHPVRAAAQV